MLSRHQEVDWERDRTFVLPNCQEGGVQEHRGNIYLLKSGLFSQSA